MFGRSEVADRSRRHWRHRRGEQAAQEALGINRGETLDEREDQHGYAEAEEPNQQHATRAALIG